MTPRTKYARRDIARRYGIIGFAAIVFLSIGVYLSYTAIKGLPFAPSYQITAEVPNSQRLVQYDDVRIGGIRVGQVENVSPAPSETGGDPIARVGLKLEPSAGPLPEDTQIRISSASVLGASYVDLDPGTSTETIPSGGTLPLSRAVPSVQLTDLLDIFDSSTARSIRGALGEMGPGFGGRGGALNLAIGSAAQLLPPFTDVAGRLAAPNTRFSAFLEGYEAFFAELAPVRKSLADVVRDGATTFGALADERAALGRTIEALPRTEAAVTPALTRLAPSLDRLGQLAVDLRPAGRRLPGTIGDINDAAAAGVRPLRQLPEFAHKLEDSFTSIDRVASMASTDGTIRKLKELIAASQPIIDVVAEAQINCNTYGLWGTNFGAFLSDYGFPGGPNTASFLLTSVGATGSFLQNKEPSPDLGVNYFPEQSKRECESGNERFDGQQLLTNPPGRQSTSVPDTDPPPGTIKRAREAGLIGPARGVR